VNGVAAASVEQPTSTAIKNAALAAAAANPNLTPGFYGGADYETLGCLVICV